MAGLKTSSYGAGGATAPLSVVDTDVNMFCNDVPIVGQSNHPGNRYKSSDEAILDSGGPRFVFDKIFNDSEHF
jgi:hypothetical protein